MRACMRACVSACVCVWNRETGGGVGMTSLARRTWTSLLACELRLGKELRTASEPFPKSSLVPGTKTFKTCSRMNK